MNELDLSIVIPYRPQPSRAVVYTWVRRRIYTLLGDAEFIEGHDADRAVPFNRAQACNEGIGLAQRSYVLVGDADIVYDRRPALKAIELLERGIAWVMGYTYKCHLSEESTAWVVAQDPGIALGRGGVTLDPLYPPPALGGTSSFVVIRREIFPAVRFDERFIGWAKEDQAFAAALDTLVGPSRAVDGDLFHLWHPYVGNEPNPSRTATDALWERYRAAEGDSEAMSLLLKEAP